MGFEDKKMDIVSLEKCKSEENLNLEIQTHQLTPRFELETQLHCSEKEEKNEIDTDEEKEEEWKMDEYICCVCGLRGTKVLDYFSSGCNQQEVAHRYCALKEIKDESLEAKDESSEGKGMSVELSTLFKKLKETRTSVIDHFIRKKLN